MATDCAIKHQLSLFIFFSLEAHFSRVAVYYKYPLNGFKKKKTTKKGDMLQYFQAKTETPLALQVCTKAHHNSNRLL